MPFYLSYTLLTGSGTRFADTAAEALILYQELKDISAGAIAVRNEKGEAVSLEQLGLIAATKTKRDRDPGFSA
jgi:hypothetical protein